MTESLGRPFGEPAASPGAYPPPTRQPYPGLTPPPTGLRNGLGMASLVIGIVALAASVSAFGGVILGVVATAMGQAARGRVKRGEATNGGGLAVAGIVFGIVAIVVSLSILVALVVAAVQTGAFNSTYQHCIGEHLDQHFCDKFR